MGKFEYKDLEHMKEVVRNEIIRITQRYNLTTMGTFVVKHQAQV